MMSSAYSVGLIQSVVPKITGCPSASGHIFQHENQNLISQLLSNILCSHMD